MQLDFLPFFSNHGLKSWREPFRSSPQRLVMLTCGHMKHCASEFRIQNRVCKRIEPGSILEWKVSTSAWESAGPGNGAFFTNWSDYGPILKFTFSFDALKTEGFLTCQKPLHRIICRILGSIYPSIQRTLHSFLQKIFRDGHTVSGTELCDSRTLVKRSDMSSCKQVIKEM